MLFGLLGMAGFGVCGLWGLSMGASYLPDPDAWTFVVMALIGLGIALLFFLLVRAIVRRVRGRPSAS